MHACLFLATILLLVLSLAAACASPAPAVSPTKPAAATAAATPAPVLAAPTAPPAAQPQPTAAPPSPTPAPKIKRGGTLVFGKGALVSSLDPIFDTIGQTLREMGAYESLLRYEVIDTREGKQELRPQLAESWERIDPTTVVFKLRKGAKFHDGSDFNAEVAKWSLERLGSNAKSLSKGLVANIASMEVVDPYTLRVNYKNPSALQLLNLTPETGGTGAMGPMIVSKAQMASVGEEAFGAGKASGTGPVRVVEWKRDNEITLAKFDGHWQKGLDGAPLPYVDGVRYRLIGDAATQLMELKAGSVHIVAEMGAANIPSIRTNPDVELIIMHWAPRPWYFGFNQEKEPFGKNLKLRQAAQYATDRASVAKVLALDAGAPTNWLGWIPAWAGYDDKLPHYDFDLDKAKSLVKEAGYADGVDLVTLHYTGTANRMLAEVIQSMWAKAGIRMNLESMETVAARAKIKAGNFESHQFTMGHSPDPAGFNRTFTCEGAANWSNYCNREVDKCMFEGERELDPAKRNEIYKRCQKMMYEDALVGGIYQAGELLVVRKEVKGLKITTYASNIREVWLDK